jgi:hypothetical protein
MIHTSAWRLSEYERWAAGITVAWSARRPLLTSTHALLKCCEHCAEEHLWIHNLMMFARPCCDQRGSW